MQTDVRGDTVVIVFPEGTLQDDGRKDFKDTLMSLARTGTYRKIVVDLGKTTWFSSIDLGILAFALKECNQRNISLALAGAGKRVHSVFETTKMDRVFAMYDSVDAAIGR